jgi:hypothetical protein
MENDIFSEEVDAASEAIQESQGQVGSDELPAELQEQVRNIESLVSMNPSVTESEEYKDLMAKIDEHQSGQAEEEDEDEEEEEEESQDEEEEDSEEEEESDDDEEEEEIEEDIDDPFGQLGGKSKKKTKKVKVDFDIPEAMEAMLNSKYGIDDASTFFTSVDGWRTQAQEGATAKRDLDALSADISNLPPDLRESIGRWADGEDYTAPFTDGGRLDFSSDFLEQDVESLVEHYLPDEYTRLVKSFNAEDGMEEDEFNDKMDLLARSTKRMFTQESKDLVDGRVQYEQGQADLRKKVKSSALDSVELLSKDFPNFSKSELSKIQSYLVDGKVDSLFYNADGTYTEKAAEMVANTLLGNKMRDTIEKLAKRKGKSEANQDFVDSSTKSVKRRKSSNQKGKTNLKAVQHLKSVVTTNDPYA